MMMNICSGVFNQGVDCEASREMVMSMSSFFYEDSVRWYMMVVYNLNYDRNLDCMRL